MKLMAQVIIYNEWLTSQERRYAPPWKMYQTYHSISCITWSWRNNWWMSRWVEKPYWFLERKGYVNSFNTDWKVIGTFVRNVCSVELVHEISIQKIPNFHQSRNRCILWRTLPWLGRMHIEWRRITSHRAASPNWGKIPRLERKEIWNVMQWIILANFLARSWSSEWKSDVARVRWWTWSGSKTHREKPSNFLNI